MICIFGPNSGYQYILHKTSILKEKFLTIPQKLRIEGMRARLGKKETRKNMTYTYLHNLKRNHKIMNNYGKDRNGEDPMRNTKGLEQ